VNKGLIFDIRRFSVHDGPGIRTTIFFKGCPLSCWWCHNPESKSSLPEDTVKVLTLEGKKFPVKEVLGKYLTVDEVMTEVEKDRLFFDESSGGVTLSGGEPLLQAGFAIELLKKLKEKDIHTALDTCGFVRQDTLKATLPFTDLYLFDLKLMDEHEHLEYTGVSNTLIHQNLIFLTEQHKQVIIRIPVIPGITDSRKNMDLLKEFLIKLQPCISEICLLPYHSLGNSKYDRLKIENKLKNVKSLTAEELQPLKQEFEEEHFEVKIGG